MSVMTTSRRVTRAMRAAIKETISPANQGSEGAAPLRSFSEAGDVNHHFGKELHQRLNAYTGSIDEFGCPGNTVDNWRVQFSRKEAAPKAANSAGRSRRRS